MVEKVDALIEGFSPGITERLGLGPKECAEHNPELVYGRTPRGSWKSAGSTQTD